MSIGRYAKTPYSTEMAIHRIEGVTPEVLDKGLGELRSSGFTVDGNRVEGMGVEATYELNGDVLTVNVEKSPAYLGGMVEAQLRAFFG